jgi:hypothetical protein
LKAYGFSIIVFLLGRDDVETLAVGYARSGMESSALRAIARVTARERQMIALARKVVMDEPADKLAALADVVRALDRLGAPHAVVGGVAVGLRSGVPRATIDTDVAVRSTVERSAIIEALMAAGLRLRGNSPIA